MHPADHLVIDRRLGLLTLAVLAVAGCSHLASDPWDPDPVPPATAESPTTPAPEESMDPAPVAATAADPLDVPVPAREETLETLEAELSEPDPLILARTFLEQRRYREALLACLDQEQVAPDTPGLAELKDDILNASLERRAEDVLSSGDTSKRHMALDALEAGVIPETFRLERILPTQEPEAYAGTPIMKVLDSPVTMHLDGADLPMLLEAFSTDTNINIIADSGLGKGKTIDVEVDDVPLREVLQYISRNFQIHFYFGENMIWATTPEGAKTQPLQTRVFTFQKGLQFQGVDWGELKDATPTDNVISMVSGKATVLPTGPSYVETIITNFVPHVEGAKLHLDHHTHTLFVRNTPENMELIAEIIERLDVNPPQILIEARFIEITVSDLRELGIEWVLDSPWVTSRTTLTQDGTSVEATRTQIDEGDLVQFIPYTTDDEGAFPLGPQGSFGLDREGNPPTADQGLNMTYRGVLTEPMFQAVLHALEISGKGQLVSVPRVTTLNNNPAKLRSGEDLLYFSAFKAQPFNLVDANNKRYTVSVLFPEGEPKLEELGVTLVAVPSVGADRRSVSLLLTPTISKLEGFVSYQNESFDPIPGGGSGDIQQVVAKLPLFSRREIQTKLVVQSGETVVLGGLIDTVSQNTVHRIPILGSLPVIGRLFENTATTEENKNLLVFVTATVISERGESLLSPPTQATLENPLP